MSGPGPEAAPEPPSDHTSDQPSDQPPEPLPVEEILKPRKPRTLGGAIYLAVLGATLVGLLLVVADRWREGLLLMGVAILFAAMARAVVSEAESGMLGLRRKPIDVVTLVLLGGGLVTLSLVIPEQAL